MTLSSTYAGVTPRNEVFCERKKDGRWWILFPTWYGRGADAQGYFYTSGVLRLSDFTGASGGQLGGGEIDAFGVPQWRPAVASRSGVPQWRPAGIDANWYRVMLRMD